MKILRMIEIKTHLDIRGVAVKKYKILIIKFNIDLPVEALALKTKDNLNIGEQNGVYFHSIAKPHDARENLFFPTLLPNFQSRNTYP